MQNRSAVELWRAKIAEKRIRSGIIYAKWECGGALASEDCREKNRIRNNLCKIGLLCTLSGR